MKCIIKKETAHEELSLYHFYILFLDYAAIALEMRMSTRRPRMA